MLLWLALLWLAGDSWLTIPLPAPPLTTGETPSRKPLPATMPGGVAVFDYDGDGRLDLFFPNGGSLPSGPKAPNTLLRNLGGFRFENVTARAGLTGLDYDFAAAAADYDRDGRIDLLVAGLRGVRLFRNTATGRFEDVTARSGIDNRGRWSTGAAWFDLDLDGDLDLFLVNYVVWNPATERQCLVSGQPDFCHPRFYEPSPNALFRNNGDGTFTDISAASGIAAHPGKGMAAAVADFNGDSLPDIYVTNDRVFSFLFLNLGQGRFREAALEWGAAAPLDGNPASAMGADAQDYDNDSRPDLVYSALPDETFPLHRNRAGREFADVTASSNMARYSRPAGGWGIVFADLDNDTSKDLVVARSGALSQRREPLSWFRQSPPGKFQPLADLDATPRMYRGLVAADLNEDGCLDIVVTALGESPRILPHPCRGAKNWLAVAAPRGVTRVRVDGQWREAFSTTLGYGSSYAGPLHFGLGEATEAEIQLGSGPPRRVRANQVIRP